MGIRPLEMRMTIEVISFFIPAIVLSKRRFFDVSSLLSNVKVFHHDAYIHHLHRHGGSLTNESS